MTMSALIWLWSWARCCRVSQKISKMGNIAWREWCITTGRLNSGTTTPRSGARKTENGIAWTTLEWRNARDHPPRVLPICFSTRRILDFNVLSSRSWPRIIWYNIPWPPTYASVASWASFRNRWPYLGCKKASFSWTATRASPRRPTMEPGPAVRWCGDNGRRKCTEDGRGRLPLKSMSSTNDTPI